MQYSVLMMVVGYPGELVLCYFLGYLVTSGMLVVVLGYQGVGCNIWCWWCMVQVWWWWWYLVTSSMLVVVQGYHAVWWWGYLVTSSMWVVVQGYHAVWWWGYLVTSVVVVAGVKGDQCVGVGVWFSVVLTLLVIGEKIGRYIRWLPVFGCQCVVGCYQYVVRAWI